VASYAGTAELIRVLPLRNPTEGQGTAMVNALEAAAYEINSECFGDGTVMFGTPYPALAVEVNIERAVEHWEQQEKSFGIIGLGGEGIPVTTAQDTWRRHAHKLAPLKGTKDADGNTHDAWGIA
jgi:hypothetical protein